MNKKELIDSIAVKSKLTKKDSDIFLAAFVDVVAETLAKGDNVKIVGFGNFEVTERDERVGRNPATGESVIIPATKGVKFKVSKNLREVVNG